MVNISHERVRVGPCFGLVYNLPMFREHLITHFQIEVKLECEKPPSAVMENIFCKFIYLFF